MKFLVDNQLLPALSQFFVSKGFISHHVMELGLGTACDQQIWNYAQRNGFIIVSKDNDFLYLSQSLENKVGLIWVRLGNLEPKC